MKKKTRSNLVYSEDGRLTDLLRKGRKNVRKESNKETSREEGDWQAEGCCEACEEGSREKECGS
jgi:hypothetical protein